MKTTRACFFAAATLGAIAIGGCTTTVFSGPGFDDGGDGGTGGSGASGGNTTTTVGGGGTCAGFEDESGANVSLTITNNTNSSVYVVPAECQLQAFPMVSDMLGNPLRYQTGYANCGFTCEMLQTSPPICTADACAEPPIIELTAGASYVMGDWNGTLLDPTEMPLSCHFEPQGDDGSCEQRLEAPAGAYDLGVEIYSELVCATEICEPCPIGDTCEHQGAVVMGAPRLADIRIAYPEDTTVELNLQ